MTFFLLYCYFGRHFHDTPNLNTHRQTDNFNGTTTATAVTTTTATFPSAYAGESLSGSFGAVDKALRSLLSRPHKRTSPSQSVFGKGGLKNKEQNKLFYIKDMNFCTNDFDN